MYHRRRIAAVVGATLVVLFACSLAGIAGSTSDAADWLASQQDAAGWFPWTPATSPPTNTQGPSGMGMLNAYLHTKTSGYLLSATDNGAYMLDPMWASISVYTDGDPCFATHDPLFMEALSISTGDAQYADFVQANFWDKLTAGTYGSSNDLGAARFGAAVVNGRNGQGIVELSPWDLSATAIAAHLAGEHAIRDALMGAILDGLEATTSAGGFDVIGLAGAIWASAMTGIDLDPTAGVYAGDDSTADLAATLAGFTLTSDDGAWLYSSTVDPSDDTNADTQTTAFAIAALNAFDRATYIGQIARGVTFIRGLQQSDGQFLCYPGAPVDGTGSVEVNAEAISAIVYVAPPTVYVDDGFAGLGLGDDPAGPGVAAGYDAFDTIQEGVDEVQVGGMVQIAGDDYFITGIGEYVENVIIARPLTLEGTSWPAINPTSGAAIMLRSPGGIPLVGVTIDGIDSYSGAYGILLDEDMFAHLGEELDVRDLTVTGASWYQNHANEGIAILNGAYVANMLLDGVWADFNRVGLGISGAGTEVDGLTLQNGCSLMYNDDHGLLILSGPTVSNLLAQDTRFAGNSDEGVNVKSATLDEAQFDHCSISGNGGFGLWFQNATVSDLAVTNSLIEGNGNSGMALHSGAYHGVLIEGNTFENNAWEHLDLGLWGGGATFEDVEILYNVFAPGAQWAAIFVDTSAGFGPDEVKVHYNVFTVGDWAIGNNSSNKVDASLNWWGDPEGTTAGAPTWGSVIYSPWLGTDPDGDPGAVGVQVTTPMLIIVDELGAPPSNGYLNQAIIGSNELPFDDTIEVRHGTYDASETITDGVEIVSEVGSAAHTTLTGPIEIKAPDVLLGKFRQGFSINGPITVGSGVDATTIHINWNDIYGFVTNEGDGLLDATFNFWGDDGPDTVGLVNVYPYLPETSDTIIGYMDDYHLTATEAIEYSELSGSTGRSAFAVLQLMKIFGFTAQEAMEIIREYGRLRVNVAVSRCHGDFERFLIGLAGYGADGGLGGGGGGVVGPSGLPLFTIGDMIPLEFQAVHPATGEPVSDVVVNFTISRTLEDGSPQIVAFGVMAYDADLGLYTFEFDSSGLEPGIYDIYMGVAGTGTGDSQHMQIELVVP